MTLSNTSSIGNIAISVAIVVTAVLGFVQVQKYMGLESDRVLYQAVDECIKNSGNVQTTDKLSDTKQRVLTEPIQGYYTLCMKGKGLATNE